MGCSCNYASAPLERGRPDESMADTQEHALYAFSRVLQQGALPGGIKSTQTPINVISCLVVYRLCNARREIRLTWKLLLTVVAVDCSVQDVPSVRMYIPTGYTEEASAVAALAVRPNEADQLQPIDPLSVQETAEAMGGGLSLYIVTGNKSSEFSAMRESNQGFASPRYISYPVRRSGPKESAVVLAFDGILSYSSFYRLNPCSRSF